MALAADSARVRLRAVLVLVGAAVALAAPLLLALPGATQPASPVVVARALDGDVVTVDVKAYDSTGALAWSSAGPVRVTANGTDGPLRGLGPALLNATSGETLNVTLPPAEAFGEWSWDLVVNVTRVDTVPRESQVSTYQLERYLGHAVAQGDVVDTPSGPARVLQTDAQATTLRLEPTLGQSVQRSQYWLSTVTALDNSSVTFRADPTIGTPVHVRDQGASYDGNVTNVTDATIVVDFNPGLAGKTLLVRALVDDVKAGASTVEMVARAEALDCQTHHAGMVAFRASTDVSPNANGTAWVNVTVTNPWLHTLQQADVRVGNDTQPVPPIEQGVSRTLSFLEPAAAKLPVVVSGDAHFSHGGGIPDDASYRSNGVVDTSVRQAGVTAVVVSSPFANTTLGRWLGWLAVPALVYPAWQGYQARQRRLSGEAPSKPFLSWIDWHIVPALVAIALSFVHGLTLMLSPAYAGQTSLGLWLGVAALALLAFMGASGLIMARWMPVRWKQARGWHAWLTIAILALGALHALLIGTTLKFLR